MAIAASSRCCAELSAAYLAPVAIANQTPSLSEVTAFTLDRASSNTPWSMDAFTREGPALDVALTTSTERVIGLQAALFIQHGAPSYLRSNNGAEFVA